MPVLIAKNSGWSNILKTDIFFVLNKADNIWKSSLCSQSSDLYQKSHYTPWKFINSINISYSENNVTVVDTWCDVTWRYTSVTLRDVTQAWRHVIKTYTTWNHRDRPVTVAWPFDRYTYRYRDRFRGRYTYHCRYCNLSWSWNHSACYLNN